MTEAAFSLENEERNYRDIIIPANSGPAKRAGRRGINNTLSSG